MPVLALWGREWQPIMMTETPPPARALDLRFDWSTRVPRAGRSSHLHWTGTGLFLFLLNFELNFRLRFYEVFLYGGSLDRPASDLALRPPLECASLPAPFPRPVASAHRSRVCAFSPNQDACEYAATLASWPLSSG